jgi:hypothetical protein
MRWVLPEGRAIMPRAKKDAACLSLPLRVSRKEERNYAEIEYHPVLGEDWDTHYVSLTGYCGLYDPHIFAAAPVLAEALKVMIEAAEKIRFDNMKAPLAQAKAAMRLAKVG